MNRLFFKIFLSFWLAMILIVVAIGWIHHESNVRYGASPLPDHLQFMLRGTAEQAADFIRRRGSFRGGRGSLEHWLERPMRQRLVQIFVFDDQGLELLGRPLPPPLAHLAEPGVPPNRQSSPHFYALTTVDDRDRPFRVIAVSNVPPRTWLAPDREGLLLRTTVAAVISAVVCLLLARVLTGPIRRLNWAAREMAEGNLGVRVGSSAHGQDEIGRLARQFDRMAERLERSLGLQRALLIDVSHELRSPLARLQIAAELARQRAPADAAPEFERIEREIGKIDQLIGEALDLSRSGLDAPRLACQSMDVVDLLAGCVDDARLEADDQSITLSLSSPERLELQADPSLLGRAIDNVLRNALRHGPRGSEIEVILEAAEEQAVLTIADRGPGVAGDQLDAIFRPFYRIGEARDRESGGYGLGLAIARNAVERHGGTIRAENREGGGLRVILALPTGGPGENHDPAGADM